MKYYFFIPIFLLFFLAQAQLKLTGKVLNSSDNSPIEFAEIQIFNADSQELAAEDFTKKNGVFNVELNSGKYTLVINAIGFAETEKTIDLKKNTDLGDLIINPEIELEGVEIEGDKPLYRYELDKKVYDISKDLSVRGANLIDALQNIPSVNVDVDGTVSLRGSSNVRFLVDGKPSGLLGISDPAEALRQFSANQIERVEIITNPSARYEAQGTAGIINIILKKSGRKGFNGSIEGFAGYFPNYGGNINLSWKKEKFTWFVNGGYQYQEPEADRTFDLQNFDEQGNIDSLSFQSAKRVRRGNRYNASLGSTFDWNEKNSLASTFSFRISDFGNTNDIFYNDLSLISDLSQQSNRFEFEDEQDQSFQWDMTYDHKFDLETDRRLSLSGSWQNSSEEEFANIRETLLEPTTGVIANDRTQNIEDQTRIILQADYINPFKKGALFEFGGQYAFNNITNDFFVQSLSDTGTVDNPDFTDVTEYDEKIYAFYAQYGNTFKKFSFQTGLRTEVSDIAVLSQVNNARVDKEYTSLFPSLFLNYNFTEDHQIQLNFSRRISRPRSRFLIPFFTFADDRNTFRGNSDLDPAFTWSSELNWVKKFGKFRLTPGIFYRRTSDEFEIVVERTETEIGDSIQTTFVAMPININRNIDLGIEVAFDWKPTKWWQLFGEISLFSFNQDGQFNDINLDGSGITTQSRLNQSFKLPGKVDFQVQFSYRGRTETNQNIRRGFYGINLGASKDLLKNKATLTLNVQDLFNSRRRIIITTGEDFRREADLQFRARQINLSFIYRFNRQKKKERQRRGGNGQRDIGF